MVFIIKTVIIKRKMAIINWLPLNLLVSLVIIIVIIYYNLFKQSIKKKSRKQLIIGSSNTQTVDQLIGRIEKINDDEVIIITDRQIIGYNEFRQQIHEACKKMGITSNSIKPSGANGVYMVVTPDSPFVTDGLTHDELANFVRYAKLPIDKKLIASKKMFDYIMNTLDEFHQKYGKPGSPSPWELYDFYLDVKNAADDQGVSLTSYITNIENKIINYIGSKDAYKKFSTETIQFQRKDDHKGMSIQGTSLYQVGVADSWKISVDIISANFTVLRLISSEIVDEKQNWKEFVSQFTPLAFFAQAKVFRQETFGKLNIKKIGTKEKEIIMTIVDPLLDAGITIDGNINTDEIIISTTKENSMKDYATIERVLKSSIYPDIWRVQIFRIKPLIENPTSSFYPFVRNNFTNVDDIFKSWIEFVCLPKIYTSQAIKYITGQKIKKKDLVFCDEYGEVHYAQKSKFDE